MTNSKLESHFAEQKASGLSIASYCKKHGLSASRWYYWQKKLGKGHHDDFVPVRRQLVKCTLEFGASKIQLDGTPESLAPILLSVLRDAS